MDLTSFWDEIDLILENCKNETNFANLCEIVELSGDNAMNELLK